MKRYLWLVPFIILSVILTGCNMQNMLGNLMGNKEKTSSKSSQQQEEKKIIAVALNEEDPNKAMFLLGIQEMAAKEEIEVKVLTEKELGDSEALKEAKILIYQDGEQSFLKDAEKNDIPILALNSLPPGVKAQGVILPDPNQVGTLMAQQIQGRISEGQVVYLQGESEDPLAQTSLAALKQESGKNSKITIHSFANPPESEAIAIQGLREHLQKNPGQVKVICAQNEKLASQAYELLKSLQLTEKIYLMGGQANPKSLQRIASAGQIADIDTAPYVQGVNALQWAQKIINKESIDITQSITGDQGEVAAKIIPVKSVTAENLSLIQKSYTKAAQAQKELEKKQEESQEKSAGSKGDKKSKSNGDGESSGDEKNSKSKEGDSQSQEQEGASSQGKEGSHGVMPEGVKKVTEKVHTEITREYLDEQGKVLGIEKSANDQVRTIPPEMLLKEQQKQQDGQQGQQGTQGTQGTQGEKSSGAEKSGNKKS
ncbi:hypothetical protein Desdi_3396 [Desulfitobacterium dichloroeliminans LMG P-21439]|uniref:Periplasmic binding protein domain-containing protein n=1 Tax=Desulfitobacterium dichloroeliminans (strain LMG P-21439 / DCA1) TaxID=871963 RepID=L0FC31_DESDL|nr:substrate-binding domain-containing protein [Desulfitobacterium dichloroeliminans]AGA70782.1 hypothetical protein Desdi_3396 [Desulfitobacterium dichloroeliminans LMG P-21439]